MPVLQGKTAIVTGGAHGIGRAVAERYAAEGARVVVADVDGEAAKAVAAAIGGIAVACDVSSPADCDRLFEAAGQVDILAANAALTATERHVLEADDTWWNRIIAVNLTGAFNCALRAAKQMAPRRRGVIILFSSGGASRAHRGNAAYDAAKGGVEALTRALAVDLAPYGIRVLCLVPGSIDSKGMPAELKVERGKAIPLGRPGETSELAGPAAFLASDDASYMTGSIVYVDGGLLAQQRSANVDIFGLDRFPDVPEAP
jgi:3-oxoacyl-[acyl-carrier protein] reductase